MKDHSDNNTTDKHVNRYRAITYVVQEEVQISAADQYIIVSKQVLIEAFVSLKSPLEFLA